MSVISSRRPGQEGHELRASLGYKWRHFPKHNQNKEAKRRGKSQMLRDTEIQILLWIYFPKDTETAMPSWLGSSIVIVTKTWKQFPAPHQMAYNKK